MRLNSFSARVAFAGMTLFLFAVGCSEPAAMESGPTYADLVTTYTAELEMLDRLEREKRDLVRAREAALEPPPTDALAANEGLLGSAAELSGQLDPDADDQELLDQVADRAEATEEIGAKLLDALTAGNSAEDPSDPGSEDTDVDAATAASEPDADELEQATKYNLELAKLDMDIAQQRIRVERARAARDAAELTASAS